MPFSGLSREDLRVIGPEYSPHSPLLDSLSRISPNSCVRPARHQRSLRGQALQQPAKCTLHVTLTTARAKTSRAQESLLCSGDGPVVCSHNSHATIAGRSRVRNRCTVIVDVVVVTAVLGPSECGGTIRFCVASGELLAVSSIAGIAEPKKTANSGIAGGALARSSHLVSKRPPIHRGARD
ncbi:hypothetical protein VTN49DRAFT_6123 [Thermomyces lanuginosus]|uniref:uncharacterized protein n=1 Tax=Thermomyces lanuginosus TaxID=5541 RepID=UPI00374492C9